MDKSAQRAVFEEWMDDGFQCTLKRDKDGNYIDRETYAAWEAWQAATEQASQSQESIIHELRKQLDAKDIYYDGVEIQEAALKAENARLRKALEEISNWRFGYDGDCGVVAFAEKELNGN